MLYLQQRQNKVRYTQQYRIKQTVAALARCLKQQPHTWWLYNTGTLSVMSTTLIPEQKGKNLKFQNVQFEHLSTF